MPRTAIPVTKLKGPIDATGDALVTFVAADVPNGNEWRMKEGDMLLVRNTSVTPYDVTLHFRPDYQGRPAVHALGVGVMSFALEIPAGTESPAVFGPFKSEGWAQEGADLLKIFVNGENAALQFAVIRP